MNSVPAITTSRCHPWRGLRAYEFQGEHRFVGREEEIAAVAALIRAEFLVVLYGASGTGKTSLLNAGVFPSLIRERFLPFRVRLDHPGDRALKETVYGELEAAARQMQAEVPEMRPGATLWETFNRAGSEIWSRENEVLTPILVLDQFEEIFTLGRADERRRCRSAAFLEELSALIEMRAPAHVLEAARTDSDVLRQYHFQSIPLRVVLSLREDFLPDLESLRARFRGLQQNRFRLLPMDSRQARAVIRLGSHLMMPEAEDAILDFACRESSQVTAPWREDETRKIFNPTLLSLFLDELSRKLNATERDLNVSAVSLIQPFAAQDLMERAAALLSCIQAATAQTAPMQNAPCEQRTKLITPEMVRSEGEHIFDVFYRRCLQDLPDPVARFIEERLLTPNRRFRESVMVETWLEVLARDGVHDPMAALSSLENQERRLLRRNSSGGHQRVELLHDVLVASVREASEKRAQEDARLKEQKVAQAYRRRFWLVSGVAVVMTGLFAAALLTGVENARQKQEQAKERLENEAKLLLLKCVFADRAGDRLALDAPIEFSHEQAALLLDLMEIHEQLSRESGEDRSRILQLSRLPVPFQITGAEADPKALKPLSSSQSESVVQSVGSPSDLLAPAVDRLDLTRRETSHLTVPYTVIREGIGQALLEKLKLGQLEHGELESLVVKLHQKFNDLTASKPATRPSQPSP